MEPTEAHEEHLVEAERADGTITIRVIVTKRLAIGDDGVVHGVPVTSELAGDLVDGSREATDLLGDPTPRPVGHRHPGRADPRVLLGPGDPRAQLVRAGEAPLVPDKAGAPTKAGKVDERDERPLLQACLESAGLAERGGLPALDVHAKLGVGFIFDTEHGDVGQTDK